MSQQLSLYLGKMGTKNVGIMLDWWTTSNARHISSIINELKYTESETILTESTIREIIDELSKYINTLENDYMENQGRVVQLQKVELNRELSENEKDELYSIKENLLEIQENIDFYKSKIDRFNYFVNLLEYNPKCEIFYTNC